MLKNLSTEHPNLPAPHAKCLALLLAWMVSMAAVRAEAPFNPPPPPSAVPPSVRGLYTPSAEITSPAQLAPSRSAASSHAAATSPVTPTSTAGARPLEGGEIVARVDGQIVLASDVLWQVDQLIDANRDRIPANRISEARRALLRQQVMGLIDTKIIYANFRRTVPAENLPSIMDNLKQAFRQQEVPRLVKMLKLKDSEELEQLLAKSGTSLNDVQQQFNERTIAGEWLRQMMPKPKEVTHEQMLAYYEEHKQEYEFPAQAKWEELMVRFARHNNDRDATWKAIAGLGNDVWQRVKQSPGLRGPVFVEMAKVKSHGFTAKDGGQHDWTTKGAMRNGEINDALFSLKVGQLSNVIESESGFHIVRVLERKEAGRTPFTEAQADIREILAKQQRGGLAEEQVAKLRKKSRVWTVFDGVMTAEELAPKRETRRR
ncbi:MAG: peptidyl-prolyl cis-trans isomerase [Planctomycetota bacterium]